MKNLFYTLVFLVLSTSGSFAQTVLNPGDIAVTEIKMADANDDPSSNDEMSLVLLIDCVAGTKFVVTDDEVDGGSLTTSEGRLEVTFGAAAACGTEINLSGQRITNNGVQWTATGGGSPSVSGGDPENLSLSITGESIIVFQDANAATTNPARYITAVNNSGEGFGPQMGGATGTTELPAGLTLGVNAFALPSDPGGSEYDNVYYNCSVTAGTPEQIRSAVIDASNWTLSNSTSNGFTSCTFTCQADCTDPTLTGLTLSPAGNPCPNTDVTILINGNLGDNTQGWFLRLGSAVAPPVQGPAVVSQFTISGIQQSGTYFVTASDCNGGTVVASITITTSGTAADAGPDQLLVAGTSTTLAGNSPAPQNGLWTVVSGDGNGSFGNATSPTSTFMGTPGVGYTLRWTHSGAGCPSTSDDVNISFFANNTPLAAGDVLFTMMNTDNDDAFAFVVLADIEAGTVFTVTDDEYRSGALQSNEGAVSITFTSNAACGSEFVLTSLSNDGNYSPERASGTGSVSVGTVRAGMTLTIIGESLIAYQGGTYLTALLNCGEGFGDADQQCSDLPPGLTEGVNALAIDLGVPDGPNNIIYDCSVSNAPVVDLRPAITDQANWQQNNGTAYNYGSGCSFTCAPPNALPVAVCQDITVEIDANGDPTTNGQPFQASDLDGGSNDPDGSIDPNGFSVDITPGCDNVTNPPTATTITLTVTDDMGATATCTSQVTVVDNVDPVLTCQDVTYSLNADGDFTLLVGLIIQDIIVTSSDNCELITGQAGIEVSKFTFNCNDIGEQQLTVLNNDVNGNQGSCMITITIEDPLSSCNAPPVAVCQDITVEIDANGNPTTGGQPFQASDLDGGSNDPDGSIDPNGFSVDITPGCDNVTNPPTATTITLTVTDDMGATATCTSQVTVEDNVDPTFNCLNTASVDLDASGNFTVDDAYIFANLVTDLADNCGGTPVIFGATSRTIECTNLPTFIFNFTLTDGNGNVSGTCAINITVNDPGMVCDDAPVPVCVATAVLQVDADGNIDAAALDNGSTDDNTAPGDLIFSFGTPLGCGDVDMPAQTVTLNVTDNAGQTSSCTSQVTVEDNIAPTADCQGVAIDLPASGTTTLFAADSRLLAIAANFQDNCASSPVGSQGGFQFTFTCDDLGINNELYGFRDGNGQEVVCSGNIIQINDPLGTCDPGTLMASCTDFEALTDTDGNYTLNANSLDNGSVADLGLYSLAFTDETSTVGQTTNSDGNNNSVGHGQSFVASQTGSIQAINVRFNQSRSGVDLYLYNSATGSGTAGSAGAPAYTQTGVQLFASPDGSLTRILLDEPFPVVQGQSYSFVFDGITDPFYSFDASDYPDGDFIFNYDLSSGCCTSGDLVFEVEFIGPTTRAFTTSGTYPTDVYAVDDQGNVSDVCSATFTLNDLCTSSVFTSAVMGDLSPYCGNETSRTFTVTADLAPGATIDWIAAACGMTGNSVGSGTSATITLPGGTDAQIYSARIINPAGCTPAEGECLEFTLQPDNIPPTLATLDITKGLLATGFVTITPEEVFDAANSSDNCGGLVLVSVTPNFFTIADIGPNTVTLTARDANGNEVTQTAVVTITFGALPVEWLSFSANAGAKTVDLQWETSAEPDNAGFHVERSPDGTSWSVIAEQAPLPANAYYHSDENPLRGENYYRVRQTDFDGAVTYSPVEVVVFTGDLTGLVVVPNPATDEFTIRVPATFAEGTRLELLDITGRTIQLPSVTTGNGIRFDASQLPRGVYLVRAVAGDGRTGEPVRVILQ